MQARDNGLGFSPITIVLHWVAAFVVVSLVLLQLVIVNADDALSLVEFKQLRNTLGLLLGLMSCYRFWARLSSFHPLPLGTPNPVELIVSRVVAISLTLACVLLPIDAWLSMSASGEAVELVGGYVLPAPLAEDAGVRRVLDSLFVIGLVPFLGGLALHVFGACKSHFILKNDSLRRMLGKHVEL
ncbi:cytochrome b [Scleromatobacter humisilvae]|uniref:Cytochrome b/b6 domain-containing protein n=1 Tax=Scleromatobacter humisilvae TaxID=2897159 RepID=A0A9X1YNR1_9BURK|nr:cytochrome b/b6 domain-containing protein [Scleromatobacter humisilvae]MCK9689426.1 cytochrome b/b6 domain-containing protein [Scleromatobacter humisilvae]